MEEFMHITYTVVAIFILGFFKNTISNNIIVDLWKLFPFLILGHFIDVIPSGVPEKEKTIRYLIYGTFLSVILCSIASIVLKINIFTLLISSIIVGWFDYLLWIARILKNKNKYFYKIERGLNWFNLKILHWYLIIDNGKKLDKFRQERYEEKLGNKSYRPLSQEKMGSLGALKEVVLMLSLILFEKTKTFWNVIITIIGTIAVVIFQSRFGKKRKESGDN